MRVFAKLNGDVIEDLSVGDESWQPPDDSYVMLSESDGQVAGIGYQFVNGAVVVPPPPEVPIKTQINNLERQDLIPRGVREFMLKSLEKEAAEAGVSPTILPAYVKLKARDDQIKLLRAQL